MGWQEAFAGEILLTGLVWRQPIRLADFALKDTIKFVLIFRSALLLL
jgi:hypothetical protein